MAKLYGEIASSALMTFDKSFARANGQPLDSTEVYYSKTAAEEYAAGAGAYVGQKIVVVENGVVTHYGIENEAGDLKELGSKPVGDIKSIVVAENGTISLAGIGSLVFTREVDEIGEDGQPTGNKVTEEVKYQPLMTKDGLIWIEPSKTTVEGLATLLEALAQRVSASEAAIGVASKPETSEGADDAVAATGLHKKIEDETARALAAEKALDEAIKAIDFVDDEELAKAVKDFTTKNYVDTELGKKVDSEVYKEKMQALEKADTDLDTAVKAAQKAADDAQATIDSFLTGTDTDGVVNKLKEIQTALEDLTDAEELAEAIANKADKVEGATEGNFAALDANGNLTDSGKKAADFATPDDVQAVDNKFANYTNTTDLTSLLAGKQDTIPENTYDAHGAAAQALEGAKADTDNKLKNYYTKNENYNKTEVDNLIKDFATDAEVNDAVAAEARIARAAEEANANAITAIKDHETVDSFADVVAELAKKQDKLTEGAYATEAFVTEKVKALKDNEVTAAQNAATAANTLASQANTKAAENAGKITTLEGGLASVQELANQNKSALDGLTTRVGTAEGKITALEENVGKKADATTVTELTGRVTAVEEKAAANETEIGKVKATADAAATKDALAEVKTIAEAATTVDEATQLANTAVSTFETNKFNPLANRVGAVETKAANNETAIQNLKNTEVKTNTEAIAKLAQDIGNVSNVMNFRGVIDNTAEGFDIDNPFAQITDPIDGDVVIYGEQEYVYSAGKWVLFGDASANANAIIKLEKRVVANETAIKTTIPNDIAEALKEAKEYADEKAEEVEGKLPGLAQQETAGLIKGTANKVNVKDGEIVSITTDALINGTEVLILNGGTANTVL